jgi:ribosomal protein S18 acetylase RimI-like enzyme
MIVIERVTTKRALIFKEIRLRALEESPTAFSSTHAKESQIPDEEWTKRALRWSGGGAVGFLAYGRDRVCGMVFCYAEPDHREQGHIVSMWVDPEFRRSGVGRLLIDSVAAWAKDRGMRELKLMVTSVNHGAIAFYERLGFRVSGQTGPYPNDPAITEFEMVRNLVRG